MNKLLLFTLAIICTSCVSEDDGLVTLRELCEKDAGLTIYKTVKADGYYDATGRNVDLVKSAYQFFEYCADSPHRLDIIPKSGCWRLSKVKRDTGQCYEPLDKKLSTFIVSPYPKFLKNHCISVKKITKPTARYSYHSELESWTADNGISLYTKNTETIMNRKTNEIIGSYTTYLFNKNPPYSISTACSDFVEKVPSYMEANFVASTIKPLQGEIK